MAQWTAQWTHGVMAAFYRRCRRPDPTSDVQVDGLGVTTPVSNWG